VLDALNSAGNPTAMRSAPRVPPFQWNSPTSERFDVAPTLRWPTVRLPPSRVQTAGWSPLEATLSVSEATAVPPVWLKVAEPVLIPMTRSSGTERYPVPPRLYSPSAWPEVPIQRY